MKQLARIVLGEDLSPKWFSAEHQLVAGDRFAVTKCSGTPEEGLALCRTLVPCILVVTEAFIEKVNFEKFCQAVDFGRSIRVLVEIEDHNRGKTARLIRMGCAGVLSRNASPEIMCRAVKAVLTDELWVDRKTLSRIVQNILHGIRCGLTPREIEIYGLLAEGLRNCQIAERLFISVNTVRWHLRSLYSKLGTHDRFYETSPGSFESELKSSERGAKRRVISSRLARADSFWSYRDRFCAWTEGRLEDEDQRVTSNQ
jgi:DNA-binding NarL/FixJ family response regulator